MLTRPFSAHGRNENELLRNPGFLYRKAVCDTRIPFDSLGMVERVRGVEPLSTGWKPVVIPIYDTRLLDMYTCFLIFFQAMLRWRILIFEGDGVL